MNWSPGIQEISLFWLFLIGNADFFFLAVMAEVKGQKGAASFLNQFSKRQEMVVLLSPAGNLLWVLQGRTGTVTEWKLPLFTQ